MIKQQKEPGYITHSRKLLKGITDIVQPHKTQKYRYSIKTVIGVFGANTKKLLYENIKDAVFHEKNADNFKKTKGVIYKYNDDDNFTGSLSGTVRNIKKALELINKTKKIHENTSISIDKKNCSIKIDNTNLFYRSKPKLQQLGEVITELKKIRSFCRHLTRLEKVFYLKIQKNNYTIEIGNLTKQNYKTFHELNKGIRQIIKIENKLKEIKKPTYRITENQYKISIKNVTENYDNEIFGKLGTHRKYKFSIKIGTEKYFYEDFAELKKRIKKIKKTEIKLNEIKLNEIKEPNIKFKQLAIKF